MATYAELRGKVSDDALRNRVTVAVVVYAQSLLDAATPTLDEQKFALDVIQNPDIWGRRVLNLVLAANKDLTIAQIDAATDAGIQTNVDDVGADLVAALAG